MKNFILVGFAVLTLVMNSSPAHAESSYLTKTLATVGGIGVGVVVGCPVGAAAGTAVLFATNGRSGMLDSLGYGCIGGAALGATVLGSSALKAEELPEDQLNDTPEDANSSAE